MQNYQGTSILKSKYLTTPIKWNHKKRPFKFLQFYEKFIIVLLQSGGSKKLIEP